MTGTHTQNPVYSRLTLALMEDTGWYVANYSVAEALRWGGNEGCYFATKSCGEWIMAKERAYVFDFSYPLISASSFALSGMRILPHFANK